MPDERIAFDKLWNYSDPAATEVKFRELLAAAEVSGDLDYRLQLLTQIARTHSLRSQFDEAHALLDTVEAELPRPPIVAEVRYCLERGRTFNSADELDKARPLFERAWQLARQLHQDNFAVDAAHMLAIVEAKNPEESLRWNEIGLELAEASSDPRARNWLGPLYNNIAWTYFDLGQYERSLEIHQRALAWREAQGQPGPIRIARWSVARLLRALDRVEEAYTIQQHLLFENAGTNEPSGYVYEELGECLLALERPEEARPYFRQAHEALSQDEWLVKHEPQRIERLRRLAAGEPANENQ